MSGENPHLRRFGVEIECGYPGGTEAVRRLLGMTGTYYDYAHGLVPPTPYQSWSVGYDGSGVELRTPPLRGREGFALLADTMNLLRRNGGFVTNSDGMHVHHDAPEYVSNPDLCVQLVRSWRNNLSEIRQLVHPYRCQETSWACPRWTDGDFSELRRWAQGNRRYDSYAGRYYDDPYLDLERNDLNITSLVEHGTIEIRLHEGTLDPEVAIAWIQFGQRFIQEVANRYSTRYKTLRKGKSSETLMRRIRLSKQARSILAEKQSLQHVTPNTGRRSQPAI